MSVEERLARLEKNFEQLLTTVETLTQAVDNIVQRLDLHISRDVRVAASLDDLRPNQPES